jgi:histidinol-phosphate aminotransferase
MSVIIPEYIKALDPYKPGNKKSDVKFHHDVKMVFSLASNENPVGTSKKVIEAIINSVNNIGLYPDPVSTDLVNILAQKFDKKPNQIICGHGSESLMAHIVNAFSDINERVLTSRGTFAGIYVKTHKNGRKLNRVPLLNYGYDLEKLLTRIHENTRIIYISNPNNPTGTMLLKDEFEWFLSQIPDNILIVLDEAYSYYAAQHEGYVNGMQYDLPNMIVLQTLSKTHGLAGMRVGYAIGPEELINTLYKVKLPFEPSLLAQKAAVAALQDEEFITETIRVNAISIKIFKNLFNRLGIKYAEPYANFIMTIFDSEQFAVDFCNHTLEHGITVRHCKPFGLADCVRISTGTEEQTEYACQVFEHVYKELINNL